MLGSPPELGDLGGDKNYCDSFFHTLIKQRRSFFGVKSSQIATHSFHQKAFIVSDSRFSSS
jgi:hypothetical protein